MLKRIQNKFLFSNFWSLGNVKGISTGLLPGGTGSFGRLSQRFQNSNKLERISRLQSFSTTTNNNIEILKIRCEKDWPNWLSKENFSNFIFNHMQQYGDTAKDTSNAIDYVMGKDGEPGGLIVVAHKDKEVLGGTVICRTMFKGFIPKNQLVYICSHKEKRGTGVGKVVLETAQKELGGDICLHVEKDNEKAIGLYEKMGFSSKYVEMRFPPIEKE